MLIADRIAATFRQQFTLRMESLRRRLEEASLEGPSYEFVEDDDEPSDSAVPYFVAVKTLIWEVVLDGKNDAGSRTLYFATALRNQDRVDEEKLKAWLLSAEFFKYVSKIHQASYSSRLLFSSPEKDSPTNHKPITIQSLNLTETVKAEELTGYMSGVIPPVGHVQPMLLLLDEALVSANKVLSVGSGSFQHSLEVSCSNLLHYANALSRAVYIASIVEEDTAPHICAEAEYPGTTGAKASIEEQDEMFLLAKLREACLHKGTVGKIQSVIDQVGGRFPEVRERLVGTTSSALNSLAQSVVSVVGSARAGQLQSQPPPFGSLEVGS